MPRERHDEGIVLKTYPYKDHGKIIHLFTLNSGVIHLIIKRISSKNSQLINLTAPLCLGKYLYHLRKSDLYSFIDGSIINLHLDLRQNFTLLSYGSQMIQAIHLSQFPGNPAPKLYLLLLAYLKKLPLAPKTLWASFRLKLLIHEGFIALSNKAINFEGNQIKLSPKAWILTTILIKTRIFNALLSLDIPQEVEKNIDHIFSIFLKR